VEVTIDGARQRGLLERGLCTEPLDWYSGDSPWGGPIASPQTCVHSLYTWAAGAIRRRAEAHGRGAGVGLFGAIELEQRTGPLLLDTTYAMRGRVLGIGQSPRTEYVWFETVAVDPSTGEDRAAMVMQLRWMRSGAEDAEPEWAAAPATTTAVSSATTTTPPPPALATLRLEAAALPDHGVGVVQWDSETVVLLDDGGAVVASGARSTAWSCSATSRRPRCRRTVASPATPSARARCSVAVHRTTTRLASRSPTSADNGC
jgi:hypothetical protein